MKNERLSRLRCQLNEEMSKSPKEWDTKKIAELNEELFALLTDCEQGVDIKAKQERLLEAVPERISAVRRQRRFRRLAPVAASLAVILGLNQWSISATGMNGFRAAYHYTKGGLSFGQQVEETEKPDPYGIREKCAEYGVDYPIPTYIPEGFELIKISEEGAFLTFNLEKKAENKEPQEYPIICIMYCVNYENNNITIPSDEKNFEEYHINGETFLVGKEDGQYRAVWTDNNQFFYLSTLNLDYSISNKILFSVS